MGYGADENWFDEDDPWPEQTAPVTAPDPRLEKRIAALEARVAKLETALAATQKTENQP